MFCREREWSWELGQPGLGWRKLRWGGIMGRGSYGWRGVLDGMNW